MRRYEAEFRMVTEKEAETVDVFKNANLSTANLLPEGQRGEMKVVGRLLTLSCDAETKDDAYTWASALAARFGRLISMKTGQHFTAVFKGLGSVPDEAGQNIFAPFSNSLWVETYDMGKFSLDVKASGLVCSLNERVLDRALTYFQRGVFYWRVVWHQVHPFSPDWGFTAAEATLNFYKAVAVILGDDRDGQRSQALGVERDLRKRIKDLYRRRTNEDVAHPTLDSNAAQQLRNTVSASQEIARRVIDAYTDLLRLGATLPAITTSTRRRRPSPRPPQQ